jgi:hypothetical protein
MYDFTFTAGFATGRRARLRSCGALRCGHAHCDGIVGVAALRVRGCDRFSAEWPSADTFVCASGGVPERAIAATRLIL